MCGGLVHIRKVYLMEKHKLFSYENSAELPTFSGSRGRFKASFPLPMNKVLIYNTSVGTLEGGGVLADLEFLGGACAFAKVLDDEAEELAIEG